VTTSSREKQPKKELPGIDAGPINPEDPNGLADLEHAKGSSLVILDETAEATGIVDKREIAGNILDYLTRTNNSVVYITADLEWARILRAQFPSIEVAMKGWNEAHKEATFKTHYGEIAAENHSDPVQRDCKVDALSISQMLGERGVECAPDELFGTKYRNALTQDDHSRTKG
jgi:hypothetical protein